MTSIKLDAVDLRILATVARDGRITKRALAEAVGLSPTPCWTRLARLEKAGLITGYHARIAPEILGPVTTVMLEVSLKSHTRSDFERFEAAMRDHPQVVGCWALGGGVDYLVRVVARDIDAYQKLIDSWLAGEIGIDRYFTYIVTKVVKDEEPGFAATIQASSQSGR